MSVEQLMRDRLSEHFAPEYLQLANESHRHNVPPDAETHFRLVMVTEVFAGQRPVARHRQVYALLQDLMDGPVHALALHLYARAEWAERRAPDSPACLGGGAAPARPEAR